MSKKNRNRRAAKSPGQVGKARQPVPGLPDEQAVRERGERLNMEIPVRIQPGDAPTQSFEFPASMLGEPQNDIERASPAFHAMRKLAERGILPGMETPPEHYESVTAGWAVEPPPLIGPMHGEVRADVDPVRVPNLKVPQGVAHRNAGQGTDVPVYTSDPDDPRMPEGLRNQLLTPSTTEPDKVPVRTHWTAGQVLEQHTMLTERFMRPGGMVLDYIRYFVGDAYRKNPSRAQGMFYPTDLRPLAGIDDPDPGTEAATQVSKIIGRGLQDALTFQATEEMVAVMRQVHDKTMANTQYLDEAELPAPAGFAWLDKPWPIFDTWGNAIPVRALTWELEYAWASMEDEGRRVQFGGAPMRVACVRVGLWTYMDDDVLYGRWAGQEHRARETSDMLGELTFMHLALLPFGAAFAFGKDEKDQSRADSILGILHTLWMFLGMEIVSTEPARDIPRLVKRQALRSLRHGEVRVVTLRKIRHANSDHVLNPRDIDWSCRWVVQGHWRHIDKYEGEKHHAIREVRRGEKHDACGICMSRGEQVRVTWIGPYMKGPDGAPLKSADKLVYRLSR